MLLVEHIRKQCAETALPMATLGWSYLGFAAGERLLHLTTIPLCPFHFLTGEPCPLCGLTRAFGSLMAGDVSDATRLHVLAVPLFSVWIVGTAFHTASVLADSIVALRPSPSAPLAKRVSSSLCGVRSDPSSLRSDKQ